MLALRVQITRFIDRDPQPGISECQFTDAHGTVWSLVDKYYIMSAAWLHERRTYPRPGSLECTEVSRRRDEQGRKLVRVQLSEEVKRAGDPTDDTDSHVEVFADQLRPYRFLKVTVHGIALRSENPLFACTFADAGGRTWEFIENRWNLRIEVGPSMAFPLVGRLCCLEVSRRQDSDGRDLVLIDTERALGAEDGRLPEPPEGPTQFEVPAPLVVERPDAPA
jgi:hypothetical protein